MLTAALVLILGLTLPSFIPLGSQDPKPEIEIYLLASPIHLDIVVPAQNDVFDWYSFLDPQDFNSEQAEWIEFGWGDRKFYFETPTLSEMKFTTAMGALFWPGEGAMHVGLLEGAPTDYEHRRVSLSKENYRKLVEAIKGSFKLKDGKPHLYSGKGYSKQDNFYAAHGQFWFGNTCNVWTARTLGAAGLKRPLWSPTKYGLLLMW